MVCVSETAGGEAGTEGDGNGDSCLGNVVVVVEAADVGVGVVVAAIVSSSST